MKILSHPIIYSLLRKEVVGILIVVGLSLVMTLIDTITISILPAILNLIQNMDAETLPTVLKIWIDLLAFLPANEQIIALLFIVVGGILLKNLIYALSLFVAYGVNTRLTRGFRNVVLESITQRNQQFFSQSNTGTIVENIVNQPEQLGQLGRALTEILINVTSLIVYTLLLFVLSFEMAVMTVIFAFIAVGIVSYYNRWTANVSKESTIARYDLARSVVEMVTGITTIRAFNKSTQVVQRIITKSDMEQRIWRFRLISIMMSAPITEMLGTIYIAFIIFWATSRADATDGATLAVLIAFIVVLVRMLIPLKEVNRARTMATSFWSVLEKVMETAAIDELEYTESGGDVKIKQFTTQIEFKNVRFSYFNDVEPVLKDINLRIPKEQTTVIIGQSGSGKSTLVNLLLNLYQPQSGQVLLNERPIGDYTLESLRERIAYVQQQPFLFDDTIANNIAFGAKQGHEVTQTDIEHASRMAIAHDFVTAFAEGYDSIVGENSMSISGGQQQRIAIARAFLRNTDIIILDEATSALDHKTEQDLFQCMDTWGDGKTVIMVTHRIELADIADWLVVFHEGTIVKQGHPDDLRDDDGKFQWLYNYVPRQESM